MSALDLARAEIRALKPYAAAAQVDDTIRLNANEVPADDEASAFRRPLNRYPEVRPVGLQQALARRFGCQPEQLLVTRGSSEAIDLLIRSFCRAGRDEIVVHTPSFSMYRHYAEIQGARVVEVALDASCEFAIDAQSLIDACGTDTRIVFVCSPNNPTGGCIEPAALRRLLEACRDRAMVVVDEAYVEFATGSSAVPLTDRFDNLVVLRTLSKALGFAGARCGALIAAADVCRMLTAVQAPYALATPVVECVEDALAAAALTRAEANVAALIAERERLATALAACAVIENVWPSEANFLLVAAADAAAVAARCAVDGILVRHFGGDLAHCLRITVGSRSDNDRLLAVLAEIRP